MSYFPLCLNLCSNLHCFFFYIFYIDLLFDLIKADTTTKYRKPQVLRSFYAHIVVSLVFRDRSISPLIFWTQSPVLATMTIYVLCFVILSKTKVIDIKRQKNENKQTNKQISVHAFRWFFFNKNTHTYGKIYHNWNQWNIKYPRYH